MRVAQKSCALHRWPPLIGIVSKRIRNKARLFFGAVSDNQVKNAYRMRVWLFFVSVVVAIAALVLISQVTQTLQRLDVVERERDSWQRPDDVIESLKLKDGNSVAEVGSDLLIPWNYHEPEIS